MISKISQRLVLFECEGVRDLQLLQRVVRALDLDVNLVNGLLRRQREEERAEWEAWVSEPVPIELHVLPCPGFAFRQQLADEIAADELQAITYARRMTTARRGLRVVLALDRRRSMTFLLGEVIATREATPDNSVVPHMKIGGRRIQFDAEGVLRSGKAS